MADEIFEIGFEISGDREALRQLSAVVAAEERVAQAARTTSQGVAASQQAASQAIEQGGRKWGELAGAVGNVGAVFSQVSPLMGRAGQIIGSVGTASTALTGALGPVGVAIGVVTSAAGLLIPLLQSTEEEMEDVGEEAESAAARVRELAEAFREADREQAQFAGIGASAEDIAESLAETNDAMRELEAQAGAARGELAPLVTNVDEAIRFTRRGELVSDEIREIATRAIDAEQELGRLAERRRLLEEGLLTARANADGSTGRSAPGLGGASAERLAQQAAQRDRDRDRRRQSGATSAARLREQEIAAEQEALQRSLQQEIAYTVALQDEETRRDQWTRDQIRELVDFRIQLDNEAIDRQIENRSRLAEKEAELRDQQKQSLIEKLDEEKQLQAEQSRNIEGQFDQLGGNVTSLVGDMVGQVIKGEDLSGEAFLRMLDSFLEATSVQYTIKALAETTEAIAAAARYDYAAAAQHGIAAGLAVAVAAATGIGAAAIPNASAPSSGTGPSSGPAALPPGGGRGGGDVTINLFAPNAVMTEAERGQLLANGLRAAKREFGASAVDY
ncbi:MAG: hypothetical protein AB7T06_29305 [Kofleriaceae bacterium]